MENNELIEDAIIIEDSQNEMTEETENWYDSESEKEVERISKLDDDENISEDIQLTKKEVKAIAKWQKKYVKSYARNKDKLELKDWLYRELYNDLKEEYEEKEILKMRDEIIENIESYESNKKEIENYSENGLSPSDWLADKVTDMATVTGNQMSISYLDEINNILESGNKKMSETILTKAGNINQNPSLDGFLAEQKHVNSFNLEATELRMDGIEARVLEPKEGQTYTKNSMDVGIYENNKLVKRYQMKYGRTAKDTLKMIKKGNYNNQRIVVPAEQLEEIKKSLPNKTIVSEIEHNGIKGKSLTKGKIKDIQKRIQDGDFNVSKEDWSHVESKKVVKGLAKNVATAGMLGMATSVGYNVVKSIFSNEKIETEKVVEDAIKTGATSGVTVAATGGLTVAVKKGMIPILKKNTSVGFLGGIAYAGIENMKMLYKMATGEYSFKDGIDKMGETTASIMGGTFASGMATVGNWMLPIVKGVTMFTNPVSAIIGGTVAYMAGSAVAKTVYNGVKKVVGGVVRGVCSAVKAVGSAVWSGMKSVGSFIDGLFGW